MAENTVSFPDLAPEKFLGNDPDEDAKSFLLTVENKINLSLGSRPTDIAERARYLFRKKHYFLHSFEDQQQNGMPTQKTMQQIGTRSEPPSSTDFQMTETNTDIESQQRIVYEATKN